MEQEIYDKNGNCLGILEDDFEEKTDWIGDTFQW